MPKNKNMSIEEIEEMNLGLDPVKSTYEYEDRKKDVAKEYKLDPVLQETIDSSKPKKKDKTDEEDEEDKQYKKRLAKEKARNEMYAEIVFSKRDDPLFHAKGWLDKKQVAIVASLRTTSIAEEMQKRMEKEGFEFTVEDLDTIAVREYMNVNKSVNGRALKHHLNLVKADRENEVEETQSRSLYDKLIGRNRGENNG